ncbi:MAG: CvpA family protein [Oscillospiraceae bacterium]|nr:CvpA family protein [Oscillospiraceae bacterium]
MSTVSIILDIIFVAVIAFGIWRGWKGGIILSVFAMVALFIALISANIVASVYSPEAEGAIGTFAGGMIDTAASETLKFKGFDKDGKPDDRYAVLTEEEKRDIYTVSMNTLKRVGVCDDLAEDLAEETAKEASVVGQEMRSILTQKLSKRAAFSMVFFAVFVIVSIIFAAIGSIINLTFELPGAQTVNKIGGAIISVVNAFAIVLFIACIFRYSGIIIGKSAVDGTRIVKILVNSNIIANLFNI